MKRTLALLVFATAPVLVASAHETTRQTQSAHSSAANFSQAQLSNPASSHDRHHRRHSRHHRHHRPSSPQQ